jgi:DNA-binding SARP family transcriptional activator
MERISGEVHAVYGSRPTARPIEESDGNGLSLRMIGTLRVDQHGRQCAVAVASRKARLLLAVLAAHGHGLVTSDRIVDALWSDSPPANVVGNVATLVSRLRSTLGGSAILGGRYAYRLGPSVVVDLYEAEQRVADAEARLAGADPDAMLPAAQRALDLLTSDSVLVEYPVARWAETARDLHRGLLRRARHIVADAALLAGDLTTARVAARSAVTADPLDEPAYRYLMRAHHAAGESDRAVRAYRELRATLAAELGIDPAPSTVALHLATTRAGSRA